MNLHSVIDLYAYGTSEGVTKAWDTRGRGRKPPPTKPIPPGKTTEDVWKDPVTRKYAPEREEWHQQFADDAIAGKVPAVGRRPIAVILGGGTASGKSTLARRIGAENPNDVHVDADSIKPQIPEHADLREQEGEQPTQTFQRNPNLASSREHEESSDIAKLILAKAAANGLDIVYDATSSGNSLAGIVNSLHMKGYDVRGVFADVPEDIAMVRAEKRAADPSDPAGFGRHIPISAMHSTHTGAAANFMLYKDSPMFDSMKLYNTIGDAPKLVYSRIGSEKGVVDDPEYWEFYKKKAAS
jgi:predicted kinase